MKIFFVLLICLFFSCEVALRNTLGRLVIKQQFDSKKFDLPCDFKYSFQYNSNLGVPVLLLPYKNDSLRFLFDTGAYTVFSKDLSERLGGENLEEKLIASTDNNGISKIREVHLFDSFPFGSFFFENLEVSVVDKLPFDLDGILGIDFLEDKKIYFDQKQNRISFGSQEQDYFDNYYKIPLKRKWNKKYYLLFVLDKRSYSLELDTGYNGFVKISEDLSFEIKPTASYIKKVTGLHSVKHNIVDYYLIDSTSISEMMFGPVTIENAYPRSTSNLFGFDMFKTRNILLDFQKGNMFVQIEGDQIISIPEKNNTHNIMFGFTDRMIVTSISVDLFNETGILPEDYVISINGKRIDSDLTKITKLFTLFEEQKNQNILDSLEIQFQRSDSLFIRKINLY